MKADSLRIDLIDKIVHANDSEVEDIYSWIANYFNKTEPSNEWKTLSEFHQKLVMQGIEEADAGLGTPFDEATQKLRDKYDLNG